MAQPPQIPIRTLSKRALEIERDGLSTEIKDSRKKLKPQTSYSSEFWTQAANVARLEHRRVQIQRQISIQDFMGDVAAFEDTEKATELFQEMKVAEIQAKLYTHQAECLNTLGDNEKSKRRSFVELFTTSNMGLGRIKSGMGRRETSDQSKFRKDCIKAYASQHPSGTKKSLLWCPILKTWVNKNNTTAAHLFGYKHGQNTMDSIFGQKYPSELFSPYNGLILSTVVERYMDQGYIAIVPHLPDEPSLDNMKSWNKSEPKEYKIQILDKNWKEAAQDISIDSDKKWGDLDGEVVEFRNNFRPRARYLYFLYCVQMLKTAWREEKRGHRIIENEIKKMYWGTPGQWLPKSMLLALVEEMGHKYEQLLEGAIKESGEEVSKGDEKLLIVAGVNQIKADLERCKSEEEGGDESESESGSENGSGDGEE